MNLKTSSTCLLIILLAVQLASCATASPVPDAIAPTPTHIAPTTTPIPSETPTPKPTETPTPTSTRAVELHGLIPEYNSVPLYSRAQEQSAIQKAKDTMSLNYENENLNMQISQVKFADLVKGDGVRMICYDNLTCLIRDTYAVNVGSDANPLIVHKLLMEYVVTFEDGSRGTVIVPSIFEQQWAAPDDPIKYGVTWHTLEVLYATTQGNDVVDLPKMITNIEANSRQPNIPAIVELWNRVNADSEVQRLLQKAHTLAKDGKFLTQDEVDRLLDAIMWSG
jgi:hypothetical protein